MSGLPSGWVEKVSNSTGRTYYYNAETKESQWEKPSGPSSGSVRASHLLVKHDESRRPSSWKEETITRSKDEALSIIESRYLSVYFFFTRKHTKTIHSWPSITYYSLFTYNSVRTYAGKTRWIVYRHQQVKTMKCRSDISQKKPCFSRIIYCC